MGVGPKGVGEVRDPSRMDRWGMDVATQKRGGLEEPRLVPGANLGEAHSERDAGDLQVGHGEGRASWLNEPAQVVPLRRHGVSWA